MTGAELAAKVRAEKPDLPVIIATASPNWLRAKERNTRSCQTIYAARSRQRDCKGDISQQEPSSQLSFDT
jgi:hypothetical protein